LKILAEALLGGRDSERGAGNCQREKTWLSSPLQ